MTVIQLYEALEGIISADLSEKWDNDGIMVMPKGDAEVKGVLCALDCTTAAINRAKETGCNVIITHHPLIFKPLAGLSHKDSVGKRVIECIKQEVAVFSFHTRLDSMSGGVNDCLAAVLGIENITSFVPYGRIGDVKESDFISFSKAVAKNLGIEESQLTLVNSGRYVKRVALVSGGGKDEILDAVKAGADTFITGEVSHSGLIDCKEYGINLICGTHYATERIVLNKLSKIVTSLGTRAQIFDFNPKDEFGI